MTAEQNTTQTQISTDSGASSTRTRHLMHNELIVVQTCQPDGLLDGEQARVAQHSIEIRLEGCGFKEVASACLWYELDQLDQGVQVILTTATPPAAPSDASAPASPALEDNSI